ncbi:putative disease resistance protein RGA1, partial [Bienertia sinuspersici]
MVEVEPFTNLQSRIHKLKALGKTLEIIVAKKNEFGLTEHYNVGCTIRNDEIRNPLDDSRVLGRNVVGRDESKTDILAKVDGVRDVVELSVLPILGMGGIGKTTLAKLVYADVQQFDLKLWVCISSKFNINHILEGIVEACIGHKTPNQNMNTLVTKVECLLKDKKYFLVLDDFGIEDIAKWIELQDLLNIGKQGSVILITTRGANVASITQTMEPHDLDRLPDHVCWSIFERLAFTKGEEARYQQLYEIGKSIVKKCCGIPLVVITLGSLLRTCRDDKEWQRIDEMNSLVELNQQYNKVINLLKISYDKLPLHLKPCFAYLSLHVKDMDLHTNHVPYMWSALGLVGVRNGKNETIEDIGYSYFMELVSRSLLQEPNSHIDKLWCGSKMHDLLHDLAMNILGEELSVVTLDNLTVSRYSKHIVWGYEWSNTLQDIEFPKELCKAKNPRTFRFGCRMYHISRSFLEGIISHFRCLRMLDLSHSWFEQLPPSIGKLKHLRYLDLSSNPILTSIPNTISKLLYLELLHLDGCEQLKEMPKTIHQMQSLRRLTMTTCQTSLINSKINRLLLDRCEELDMEKGEGLDGLISLRLLYIERVPKLKFFPNGIQSAANSLEILTIYNCSGLLELPNWLQQFSNLRELFIIGCPNLLSLPSGFCHLKSLQQLHIEKCPHLTKRCATDDYPLIQHIPKIWIDG